MNRPFWRILFVCITMVLTAHSVLADVDEGNCETISDLLEYAATGSVLSIGNNCDINGNSISGALNALTPEGSRELSVTYLSMPSIDPSSFPSTGSTNLSQPSTVAPGSYGTITCDKNSTTTFSGGDYYIATLSAGNNATIYLAPGNYYINTATLGNKTELVISPAGQVNIYVGSTFQAGNQCAINASGDTGNLVIYLYRYAIFQMGNSGDFNGLIYSPYLSTIQFGNSSNITGALYTKWIVQVGNNTTFDYSSDVQASVLTALGCGGSSTTTLDHFRIEHDGHALTCQAEEVTIKACLDSFCTSYYTDPVDVTLSPSGWVSGDTQTISDGSGSVYLRSTSAGSVTLGISASSVTASNAYQCYEGSSSGDCTLEYHDSGFVFDVSDLTACRNSGSITIQAVRLDATSQTCVGYEGFADTTKAVGFWSGYVQPASGSRSLSVNGSAIGTASPGTAVNLSFDATASASMTLKYRDAGKLILDARYDGSGDDAGLVMLGSDSFVVSPAGFKITATSDGSTVLDNSTSSGDPHWPAGEDFYAKVQAVCADGTVTPNFAWGTELTAVTPFDPASGTLNNGSIAAASFTSGVATIEDLQYTEVGTMTIQALAGDYLASGNDVSGTSSTVGRFTPHHFGVSLNTPEFGTACGSGSFTYIGQVFDYSTLPVLTVTARNKQNATTVNYTGDWWKITNSSLTDKQYSSESGTLDVSLVPSADPTIAENTGTGTGTLTFSSGGGMRFVRSAPVAPFDAEISLEIDVADTDGIACASNPARFGQASAGNGIAFDNGKEMRYGRLMLENAYGPELLDLPVEAAIQYYNGSGFVTNSDDACSTWDVSLLTLISAEESVTGAGPIRVNGSKQTTASLPSTIFTSGSAELVLSAPGEDGYGYVDIQVDLAGLEWLQFDWDGDGSYDDDPSARATFGIYKGSSRLIYQRESVD